MLDFDDTMYAEAEYFRRVFEIFGRERGVSAIRVDQFMQLFPVWRRTKFDIFQVFLEFIGLPQRELHDRLYKLYLTLQIDLDPFIGISEVVEASLASNAQVIVLTSGVVDAQRNKWKNLRLAGKDEITFIPARLLGSDKPSLDLLLALQERMNIRWSQTVAIGDNFEKDLSIPLSLSAKAILVEANGYAGTSLQTWSPHGPEDLRKLVEGLMRG